MAKNIKITGADFINKAAQMQDKLKKDGHISIRIKNDSFAPTVQKGDKIKAVLIRRDRIKKGDLILIATDEVNVRKVKKIINNGKTLKFCLTNERYKGDFTTAASNILGKVTEATRDTEKIKFSSDFSGTDIFKADLGTLISRIFKRK